MFSNDAFAQLDWIVIETTGLADPAPLIQSFYMDKECQSKLRLDGVLTVVDCKHLPIHLAKHRSGASGAHGGVSEAVKQIAYADRVLLSKMDLVRQAEVEALKTSIAEINRNATIFQCSFGNVDICEVLNINAFSPQKAAALMTSSTDGVDRPILIERGSDGKIVKKNTRLAFAANVDASKQSKQSSSSVMTVSLVCDEPVDLNKFNVWMSGLLKAQGPDIYRMKGILSMDGYDEKFVIQVIHMIFDGDRAAQWAADEPRRSKLVIIGTNLDRQQLEYGFIQTIAEK